MTEPALHI